MNQTELQEPENSEKIFNLPSIILILLGSFLVIHLGLTYLATDEQHRYILFTFGFLPTRYTDGILQSLSPYAIYWTPITYAFLHGSWSHLILNSIWMMAFGGVVAKRIGNKRFIWLFIAGAIGGIALHVLLHGDEKVLIIGASAVVSATIGASTRFAFPKYRPVGLEPSDYPRLSLVEAFTNKRVLFFLAIWFFINFITGVGLVDVTGEGQKIAWEAHVGGFLVGFLGFSLFDRPQNSTDLGQQ